ncbi:MAG: hypothetical protein P8R42_07445 [Candidatus Binatia bacterium]|nr:hypothetical protein [Candidatus Binatia bacterium]
MAASRTVDILSDGPVNAMLFVYLAVEIVVMSLALLGLRTAPAATAA